MVNRLTFHADDEESTERFGAALAEVLPAGAVVSLIGTLGAGKTRLVQAVGRAGGVVDGAVVSPTFVLIAEYQGRRPIYHFDAYRLRDEDEFRDLGPDEYFESEGITFVEWGDRVTACLPPDRFEIQIEGAGPTAREIEMRCFSEQGASVLEQLQTRLGS